MFRICTICQSKFSIMYQLIFQFYYFLPCFLTTSSSMMNILDVTRVTRVFNELRKRKKSWRLEVIKKKKIDRD